MGEMTTEKGTDVPKAVHGLGVLGLLLLALSGYAHFDYMDCGFVCVTQGQIDTLFAVGIGVICFYAGYIMRWKYE